MSTPANPQYPPNPQGQPGAQGGQPASPGFPSGGPAYGAQGYPGPPQQGSGPGGAISQDERTMSILAHLSAIIAFVVSAGWLSILGPLIIWLIQRDRSPMVRRAAAGAFNFNLAAWILSIVAWICLFTIVLIPVAIVIWVVVFVVSAWCHVRGALKASRGELYDYPFQIRLLS